MVDFGCLLEVVSKWCQSGVRKRWYCWLFFCVVCYSFGRDGGMMEEKVEEEYNVIISNVIKCYKK